MSFSLILTKVSENGRPAKKDDENAKFKLALQVDGQYNDMKPIKKSKPTAAFGGYDNGEGEDNSLWA